MPADRLLTLAKAAKALEVHERTVRREIERGRLFAIRVGDSYRIPRAAFLAYVRGEPFDPSTYDPLAEDAGDASTDKTE
jgi:excisionase family DNA binding protein